MADELTPEEAALLEKLKKENPALLQQIVSGAENAAIAITGAGNATAETHFHAETIQIILESSGVSDDESHALAAYLDDKAKEWQVLPLGGIDPDHTNVESRADQPKLSEVYVELHLREPRPESEEEGGRRKVEKTEGLVSRHREEPWKALEAGREHRRLVVLGDPGSGKSTFVRMLAFHLASNFRNQEDEESGDADSETISFPEPLVPILVNLRDFAAADLDDANVEARLARFIRKQLEDDDHEAAYPLLQRLWREGRAVLFLDGLDEIARSERRDYVLESIRGFAGRHRDARILVTCRVAAYERFEGDEENGDIDWRLPSGDFPVVTLAPFTRRQQHRFIRRWYLELKTRRRITGDPDRKTESLCRALERSHIARLAPNPLLLTVMTIVHADKGELPHERVKLYDEAVDTLLRRWRQGRDPGEETDDPDSVASILAEVDRTIGQLEQRLWKLAWDIHGKTPDSETARGNDDPVADISFGDLVEHLSRLHPDRCREWTTRLIEAIKHRSGLLVERKRGVFTFPHRTFQEYLAARELVKHPDFTREAYDLLRSKTKLWREVVLLAAGSFAHQLGNPAALFPLLRTLLEAEDATEIEPSFEWIIAADLACEMRPQNVRDSDEGVQILDDLIGKLLAGMTEPSRRLQERFACGSALGSLGDPRAAVADLDVRKIAFWSDEIPADPFPMGNDGDKARHDDEKPRFDCSLIESAYAISRHPVTVAQFDRFVEASGYREAGDRFWSKAGRAWRGEHEITGPEIYSEVFQTPNHPQVGVSWYEAAAFCAWLAEASGLPIRLPTEPEYERAARHTDARTYPWGELDSEKAIVEFANTIENKLNQTSAVGLFETGRAECGAADLAGNVWEWTGSLWTDDYRDYQAKHQTRLEAKARRVLRGGAWSCNPDFARCAFRFRFEPLFRNYYLGFRLCVSPFSASEL